jgi:hypothetical protein
MIYQHGGKVMTGFVQSLQQHIATMDSPAKLLYGFVVVVIIVYSSIIPSEYRMFADSILGRIFGIAIVYGVVESVGWIYGLLTALAFLLIINGAPQSPSYRANEGFEGGGSVSQKDPMGGPWYVEKVLHENTKKIATDKVTTSAIQD